MYAIAALAVLLSQPLHAEPAPRERLALSTIMLPPLGSTPATPGFLEKVAREAFHRIGREIDVDTTPGERSLINANSGLVDGELMRRPGFEAIYPNLIRVPEKIGDMDFVAYTNRQDIKGPVTWDTLASYVVAYPTGWKIFDKQVKARQVTKVRAIDDLFVLLDLKRADIVLADRWEGLYAMRKDTRVAWLVEPPLASLPMFMYLNKRHAALVPEVARALAAMKADGTYKRIFDTTLKPYGNVGEKQ